MRTLVSCIAYLKFDKGCRPSSLPIKKTFGIQSFLRSKLIKRGFNKRVASYNVLCCSLINCN